MGKFEFTKEDLETLLENPANAYLTNKTAEEKYADFSKTDPFPKVHDALLNSADIVRYVYTTGMIDEFCFKNLSGATYTCNYSGRYCYWDDKNIQHKGLLEDDELILPPNSITFLEIEQFFRIPIYIVLRFNLKVSHVYKGLLLGTGPIVDPNFVGHLYIPLHNLTSNEYSIKKGAELINVEFTKLSHNPDWDIEEGSEQKNIIDKLEVDIINYKSSGIKKDRSFMEYAEKALKEDALFFKKKKDEIYINSSLQEEIKRFNLIQENINKKVKEIDYLKTFFTITIISVIFAAITLFASTCWYFRNAREIPETRKKLVEQQEDFDKYKNDLQNTIKTLEKRIQTLENDK